VAELLFSMYACTSVYWADSLILGQTSYNGYRILRPLSFDGPVASVIPKRVDSWTR